MTSVSSDASETAEPWNSILTPSLITQLLSDKQFEIESIVASGKSPTLY